MSRELKDTPLIDVSKKSLNALQNLLNAEEIEIPVRINDLMDLAVGALVESEVTDQLNLVEVLFEDPDLLYDMIEFEEGGKFNLHDIISQIVCIRLMGIMMQYLNHMEVEFEKYGEEPPNED